MTAALFISAASAMIAPHRIAEIQIARAGRSADRRAANRADGSTGRRAAGGSTHQRTRAGTQQAT